jgi:glucosamine kinase
MNEYVLSVDGGGSKTIAILVDRAGYVARFSKGGGVNPLDRLDWKDEASHILHVLEKQLADVSFGCFGAPGYGEVPEVSANQERYFKSQIRSESIIENDVRLAFDGAFLDRAGVLLLAGTGAMAWASDGEKHERVGGWGETFSDEGSGHWIGREALSIVSRHYDGRLYAPALSEAISQFLSIKGSNSNDQLFAWVHASQHRRSAIASLSKIVADQAGDGDVIAADLLNRASRLLAEHVNSAKEKFGIDMPWAIAGGVGKSRYMQQHLKELLGTSSEVVLPPVGGGAWRAATAAGWRPNETWIRQLRISLKEHGVHS